MRKVIAATFLSLDGVMQGPGGPEEDPTGGFTLGGWSIPYFDDVMGGVVGRIFSDRFDLLLGRKTYEIFAAHWPHSDEQIAAPINNATKYVATRSLKDLSWQNSVPLRDAATDVAKLKQGTGPDLLIQGSSDLIQTLLAHDLIDEFTLMIIPVVLGSGKRLFGKGTKPTGFALQDTKTSTTGVMIGTYRPAGMVKTASAQLATPSPEEVARRAKMKREG